MIDKDSYGLKNVQEPHKEKENNSKNSDGISRMSKINKKVKVADFLWNS